MTTQPPSEQAVSSAEATERILELLPEIEWLTNQDLRNKVVAIWVRAWRIGNWPDLEASPFLKEIPAERWNGISHVRAVVRSCMAIADELREMQGITVDRDTLLAAALLHDVGKLIELEPAPEGSRTSDLGRALPHAAMGAQWAIDAGLSASIAQAIYAHTPAVSAMPASIEAVILHFVNMAVADSCKLALGLKPNAKVFRPPS